MIVSRYGAAGSCGGPASLLALLRRGEALARTPRLGRRRRALRPRRALRRALRRRRRRRLRRGLRRRLRLGSGRSLLALRLRELLADDDDHLRARTVGQGFSARWDRARRARGGTGSRRGRAQRRRTGSAARAFAFACVQGVHLCVWSRNAVCCVAAGRGARSWSACTHRDEDNNRNQRLHERDDRIKLRCTKGVAREACEAAVARADARMGPRARRTVVSCGVGTSKNPMTVS